MAEEKQNLWTSKISTILIVVATAYVFFLLYQSVYMNWQTSEKNRNLKAEIVKLDRDKARLEALIAYYKTSTFQELEARKKLGMKMPNEKVIIVKVEEEMNRIARTEDQTKGETPVQSKTNIEKWADYLKGEQL